jgi:hypothetical protein
VTLPSFVGVGALKAGTTYLDVLLRPHPELCFARNGVKEIDFFSHHYERGLEWYSDLFRPQPGQVCGEISPHYLFDELVPERIARDLPDVQLVVNVRNPVERAYSQYKNWVEERAYPHDFERYLEERPHAFERGFYHRLLERFTDRIPRSRIHVVVFEHLVADPVGTTQDVQRFLGVDPTFATPAVDTTANRSAIPRFHPLYVATKRITRAMYRRGAGRYVVLARRAGAARLFSGRSTSRAFAPLTPATAQRLADAYADDAAALSRTVGVDLVDLWFSPRPAER